MDLHIIAGTLDPDNVIELYLHKTVVCRQKKVIRPASSPAARSPGNRTVSRPSGGFRRSPQLLKLLSLITGLHKSVQSNRFDEIIHHIQVEPFRRKFPIGGNNDNHWPPGKALDQLKPRETWHLDIHEHQIDFLFLQYLRRLKTIPTGGLEPQIRDLADIIHQQA